MAGRTERAVLVGIAASPGLAIGAAHVVERARLTLPRRRIDLHEVPGEIERLRRATAGARARLEAVRAGAAGLEVVEAVLRAQILIVEDRKLLEGAARRIEHERINAEWALDAQGRELARLFESIGDPYLRERRADVTFAVREIQLVLLGRAAAPVPPPPGATVVVADDLSPAEVAELDRARVVAFATDAGGRTAHAVILATSLGIPAVVGLGSITQRVREGDRVIVDGRAGRVVVRPDPEEVTRHAESVRSARRRERALSRMADLPCETRDGCRIELRSNLERLEDIPVARLHGARGIGLLRTEFLFLNRTEPPDEAEQAALYRAVLAGVAPHPAAIRTVDLGSDKLPVAGLPRAEANPALGMRGVRLARCPNGPYATQLRALLRASASGRLRILLPLVTGIEEVAAVRARLAELRTELEATGEEVAQRIELGVVVETPAAVALVDLLAPEVDCFTIGTNDLIQYTVAVDRQNEAVGYLYDALHPAVLRAIRATVVGARAFGRPVGVCGEMAGDPLYTLVLVGLGVDELSMNAASIPRVKRIVRATDEPDARALAAELLGLRTAAEVGDRLRKEMRRRFPDEFEVDGTVA